MVEERKNYEMEDWTVMVEERTNSEMEAWTVMVEERRLTVWTK